MHASRPDVLFMQKHWDVMRSDDAGESWREVSGNLPTDLRRRPGKHPLRTGIDPVTTPASTPASLLIRDIHTLVTMDAGGTVLRGAYLYIENGEIRQV
jgi:hypothetical protein